MDLLFNLSALLGTNPASLMVLSVLAGACAYHMNKLHYAPGMALLHFPLLLLGALFTDDLAVGLGLYPSFDVQRNGVWSWDAHWSTMTDGLPYVLVTGTLGMCVTALALLFLARKLRNAD
ncbi:MAG: hypothetical protein R3D67_04210 [Hyphomicrobiaceae bacterium]